MEYAIIKIFSPARARIYHPPVHPSSKYDSAWKLDRERALPAFGMAMTERVRVHLEVLS